MRRLFDPRLLVALVAVAAAVVLVRGKAPPEPRAAVLVESAGRWPNTRGKMVLLADEDRQGATLTVPVGTRCNLIGPASSSTVLVELGGRRFRVDSSFVRSLAPPTAGTPP